MAGLNKEHLASRVWRRLRGAYWLTVRPEDTVLQIHQGAISAKSKDAICLFSTYDPGGRIDPYVQAYLHELHQCGFDIVVISTAKRLAAQDIAAIKPFVRAVIHRKNIGLDFGSWRAATQMIPDCFAYERLLLANDSVYGPFSPLNTVIRRCEDDTADLVGLTDNNEIEPHLQSYFLYLKRPFFKSAAFQTFWRSIRLRLNKARIIKDYEVGLTRVALSAGFRIKALFPFQAIRDLILAEQPEHRYREQLVDLPLNQTLFLWPTLLTASKFPFLKTEIVKDNRTGLPDFARWRELIPIGGTDWVGLIERHLRRAHPDAKGLKQ